MWIHLKMHETDLDDGNCKIKRPCFKRMHKNFEIKMDYRWGVGGFVNCCVCVVVVCVIGLVRLNKLSIQ